MRPNCPKVDTSKGLDDVNKIHEQYAQFTNKLENSTYELIVNCA